MEGSRVAATVVLVSDVANIASTSAATAMTFCSASRTFGLSSTQSWHTSSTLRPDSRIWCTSEWTFGSVAIGRIHAQGSQGYRSGRRIAPNVQLLRSVRADRVVRNGMRTPRGDTCSTKEHTDDHCRQRLDPSKDADRT